MRVSAVILPPRDVLEEIERLVAMVDAARQPGRSRWRSLLGRSAERQRASGAALDTSVPQLETVPATGMHVPLTAFGNVAAGDVTRLARAVGAQAATWASPTVHFTGGSALEFPGDQNVWAMLAGELDALKVIGAGVPAAVRPVGFLVDRRRLRTWMSVATITNATTAPFLEEVVARLDLHRSEAWTIDHISVVTRPVGGGGQELEELERIPLGGAR